MGRNQMTTEMAEYRIHWHVMIRPGTLRSVEKKRSLLRVYLTMKL